MSRDMDYRFEGARRITAWAARRPEGVSREPDPAHGLVAPGMSLAMVMTDMIASRRPPRGFTIVELLLVLAVGTTLMAVGTPVLRGALANQRLRAAAADLGNALSQARREAVRTSTTARVEVDPADGRISVFAMDTTIVPNAEVERARYYLPGGVQFNGLAGVASYNFDTLGRPSALPMTIQIGLTDTVVVRTVMVLGTGRTVGT